MKKLPKLVNDYARIPLICVLIANFFSFYFSRVINGNMHHYDLSLVLDHKLPFVPFFVLFYVMAFAQWVISYILIGRQNKELCFRFACADVVAKLICFVIFIAFPTTLTRPESTGGGLFGMLTSFIYFMDTPDNLFPSVHCLESWVCFRASLKMKNMPAWYKYVTLVLSVCVFMSTVLIKQHLVVDVPAGILVFEIGYAIVKYSKLDERLSEMKLFNKQAK